MSTSRKRILAATLILVVLGLGFGSLVQEKRSADSTAAAGKHENYRANHQAGHGSAVFTWIDAASEYADSQSDAPPPSDERANDNNNTHDDGLRAVHDDSSDRHPSRHPRQHDLIGASTLLAEYREGGAEPWAPHRDDWAALPPGSGGTALWAEHPGLRANDPQWANDPVLSGGGNPTLAGGGLPADGTHSAPEPGTLTLFALGVAAAALRRRRRS